MNFVEDSVLHIIANEIVEVDVVDAVQFYYLSRPTKQRRDVIFRIATEEEIIVASRVLEVSKTTELLNTIVSTNRPHFVVLAGQTYSISFRTLRLQLFLLLANHTFDRIHRQQIRIALAGPFITIYSAFLELVLRLAVRLGKVSKKGVVPFNDQFVIRLAGDEIVLVGKVPVRFSIVFHIDRPLVVLAAVVRIDEHEDGGKFSVAVEYIVGRVCCDIDQPREILKHHKGSVHIDSSMFD